MRRTRIDLAAVAAIPNLAEATARAARGKRERPAVCAFLADLEGNAVHAIVGHAHSRGWRCIDLTRSPAPEV
jgi:hypothetical protein